MQINDHVYVRASRESGSELFRTSRAIKRVLDFTFGVALRCEWQVLVAMEHGQGQILEKRCSLLMIHDPWFSICGFWLC